MKRKKNHILVSLALAALVGSAVAGCTPFGRSPQAEAEGHTDTLRMKYAQLLTIVRHGEGAEVNEASASSLASSTSGTSATSRASSTSLASSKAVGDYTEVMIRNPWKKDLLLHRYLLIPKGKQGDETVAMLAKRRSAGTSARCTTDTVRTPVANSVVFTSPHCQLMYELGAQKAIRGVCDLAYINIPDIQRRAVGQQVADCGSGMAPDIERIIALHPEALLISPFENGGGYGKLDKLHIPIIETADYMEASPLARAEWIKFYGMLFGSGGSGGSEEGRVKSEESDGLASCEATADSLFARIEKEYLWLKAEARKLPKGLSVLTERKTGSVWYVPGGQSTIGVLLKDANARYIFSDDTHSGSLAMSPEQVLAKGKQVDVWAFKYYEPQPLTRSGLLQEYEGYKALRAFQTKNIYECSTVALPYFELTSFHPEVLLREFVILSHPPKSTRFAKFAPAILRLGQLRFYKEMTQADDLL